MKVLKVGITATLLFALALNQTGANEKKAVSAFEAGDYARALADFRRLAANGNPVALNNLAAMYATGTGVKKNHAQAAKYYTLAAEQGLPIAQYNIGNLYEKGLGVEPDLETAAVWYRLAASTGDVLAQLRMGEMYLNGEIIGNDMALAYFWLSLAARRTTDRELRAEALVQRAKAAWRLTPEQIAGTKDMVLQWLPER